MNNSPLEVNRVLLGDVREQLDTLSAESVHCVVTSPPYWALRDYGVDGQLGLEATPAEYLANQVDVFRRVRRVLRDDGILWVNLGDTYSSASKWGGASGGKNADHEPSPRTETRRGDDRPDGNLLMIPYRFAIAMQDDGWILRSVNIWHKKSPMPETLRGWRFKADSDGELSLSRGSWRTTQAFEPVFMFAKSMGYFADSEAASEPAVGGTPGNKSHKGKLAYEAGDHRMRTKAGLCDIGARDRRNPRNVWSLSSEPFSGQHFAAYPTELVRRCIEASTSSKGCCPICGNQWAPIVSTQRSATRTGTDSKVYKADVAAADPNVIGNRDPQRHITRATVVGHRPTCDCGAVSVPSLVLDPYAGSGTTLQVAYQLARNYLGIELNPEYLPLIEQRIKTPLKSRDWGNKPRSKSHRVSSCKTFDFDSLEVAR